jgi:hypothetical protein
VIGDWVGNRPADSVHVATPPGSGTVSLPPVHAGAGPVPVAANENVTVPPGVPLAGDTDDTVAVNVGASPLAAGFSDDCNWTAEPPRPLVTPVDPLDAAKSVVPA